MGLVAGVGINDLDYNVSTYENIGGKIKQVLCPYYNRWKDVLRRTNPKYERPSGNNYLGCSVDSGWIRASQFRGWMEEQQWEGLQLDKDILVKGNKVYSSETCAFVPAYINTCLSINQGLNNGIAVGVKIESRNKKATSKNFRADINQMSGGIKYLGAFYTEKEAHAAWQLAKAVEIELYINRYAKEECFRTDVADALMRRVWDLRLDNANGVETKSL